MEEQNGFLGISSAAWGVIAILILAALVVLAFFGNVGIDVA